MAKPNSRRRTETDPALLERVGSAIETLLRGLAAGKDEEVALKDAIRSQESGDRNLDKAVADSARMILALIHDKSARKTPGRRA